MLFLSRPIAVHYRLGALFPAFPAYCESASGIFEHPTKVVAARSQISAVFGGELLDRIFKNAFNETVGIIPPNQ